MPLKQHVQSMYSSCHCTGYDGSTLTLQYNIKTERLNDFALLKAAIEECAAKFKSGAGAGAVANIDPLRLKSGNYCFDVTLKAAPFQGSLGPIIRAFTEYDFKRLATAMENVGCINNAAHVEVTRKIASYHQHGRNFP